MNTYTSKSSAYRAFRAANPTNTLTTAELSKHIKVAGGRYYVDITAPTSRVIYQKPEPVVADEPTKKNYIGISRDHSGSMRSIAHVAGKDYNSKIDSIKVATRQNNQDTVVSVVECGYGRTSDVRAVVTNSNVSALQPITNYTADGHGTPLFDSVGTLIEMFEKVPDANDPNVSFLVMVITDGHENSSKRWSARTLAARIQQLTATDRWTFVFRVPRGGTRTLASLGIPAGNILEWDQTERGTMAAAQRDEEAFTEYFKGRSAGTTSTQKFYTDLSSVSSKDVEVALTDVSKEVLIWPVGPKDNSVQIRDFVEQRLTGKHMLKGAGFYQLTKTESGVQDYKKILIRDKTTQAIYFGAAARRMLGLPTYGMIKLAPGNHGNFDLFIQSTSVNRKLVSGTSLVYWENVGTRYKEGVSAS